MKAKELISRYAAEKHVEHGLFLERHYEHTGPGRPASGSMYYYVAPGERTEFHRIDCDEYWCFHAGETLELWVIGLDGKLSVKYCGLKNGEESTVRFAAGEIFASRLPENADDGCFITCITVPRFSYDGFELFEKEEMLCRFPETEAFWD